MDAKALRREPGHAGETAKRQGHALRGRVQVVGVRGRVVGGDAGLRLHWIAHQPRAIEPQARDMRGARERFARLCLIAILVIERQVSRYVRVQLRRAACQRRLRLHDRRQVAKLDDDRLHGVLGRCRGLRDDQRDFLADEAHAPYGKDVAVRDLDRSAAASGPLDHGGRGLESGLARVPAREHRDHTGRSQRALHVERDDLRMRAIGAQKTRVELARKVPVAAVTALPRQEPCVLTPALEYTAHLVTRFSLLVARSLLNNSLSPFTWGEGVLMRPRLVTHL